jgi:hypothetical protein
MGVASPAGTTPAPWAPAPAPFAFGDASAGPGLAASPSVHTDKLDQSAVAAAMQAAAAQGGPSNDPTESISSINVVRGDQAFFA